MRAAINARSRGVRRERRPAGRGVCVAEGARRTGMGRGERSRAHQNDGRVRSTRANLPVTTLELGIISKKCVKKIHARHVTAS